MPTHWMISADSHVVEPPDLFVSRIERRFSAQAPRVVEEDGVDWWIVGDEQQVPAINPMRAGDRFDDETRRRRKAKVEHDSRPGGYIPQEFIRDNESDGVWGGVLYPSMSLIFYGIEDSALLSAVCRVYNDWVIEFARSFPGRLKANAMINLDDVGEAVRELERVRRLGAKGALIPCAAPSGRPYDHPDYEPFWAAAADLRAPLSLHVATNRNHGEWTRIFKYSEQAAAPDYWVRVSLGDMIMSGMFERHPALQVCVVEHEAAWAAFWLRRLDHLYTESLDFAGQYPRFKDGRLPSDLFRSNVAINFSEDEVAIESRGRIGVENLMWGSDYPHGESTFPRSREIVDGQLAGVSREEVEKLTLRNVARIFDFELPPERV